MFFILGLSSNLFRILQDIPTVVGITCRGHIRECRIYVQLILIDIRIGTNLLCGRGEIIESKVIDGGCE